MLALLVAALLDRLLLLALLALGTLLLIALLAFGTLGLLALLALRTLVLITLLAFDTLLLLTLLTRRTLALLALYALLLITLAALGALHILRALPLDTLRPLDGTPLHRPAFRRALNPRLAALDARRRLLRGGPLRRRCTRSSCPAAPATWPSIALLRLRKACAQWRRQAATRWRLLRSVSYSSHALLVGALAARCSARCTSR